MTPGAIVAILVWFLFTVWLVRHLIAGMLDRLRAERLAPVSMLVTSGRTKPSWRQKKSLGAAQTARGVTGGVHSDDAEI